jgi:hypothetical protein
MCGTLRILQDLRYCYVLVQLKHIVVSYAMLWRRVWNTEVKLHTFCLATEHSDSAVGWGTALQTGRSRVRLEFFIDLKRPVNSACSRNKYQEYFLGGKGGRCLGLTSLPPSYANCLEILEPQTLSILWADKRSVQGLLYLDIEWSLLPFDGWLGEPSFLSVQSL